MRLAVAQNIDRGYLNAVTKGRKPAAEEIRLKIANHFGMTYEAMLTLGRAIEEGTVVQNQGVSPFGSSREISSNAESLDRQQEQTKSKTLQRVLEMLDSETDYSAILNAVVETLDEAMKERRENVDMARRLELLEGRMAALERIMEKK